MNIFAFFLLICLCSDVLGERFKHNRSVTVKKCGVSTHGGKSRARITGGSDVVNHGKYPWMVSLQQKSKLGTFEHDCGASVINENWIVTAAHCFVDTNKASDYEALVGLHKLSEENASTVQTIKISKIVMHEKFQFKDVPSLMNAFNYDIALVKAAKPINITGSKGYVNGICLPRSDRDPRGQAKILGWGYTSYDGDSELSDTLRKVTVPIIPRDRCVASLEEISAVLKCKENNICAGKRNKGAFNSDSGGPLFQTNSKGVSTLIGIVSFGNSIEKSGKWYPGVFSKVANFVPWIERVISEN